MSWMSKLRRLCISPLLYVSFKNQHIYRISYSTRLPRFC